ncbi:MAG: alpha-amylase family glycosyl hydrolase [Bacteroidales bacterium]
MKQSKISIYQLLPRLFGNKNKDCRINGSIEENGCGKFHDITKEALTAIRDLGITHVWYTGILEHGTITDYSGFGIPQDHPVLVKGKAGSPYAVKDYYDVDPDLAEDVNKRMSEFEALVERTRSMDLKTIIDFVPNHVFRQYQSDAKPAGVKDFGETDNTTKAFHPDNNFYYLPGKTFEIPEGLDWLNEIADLIPKQSYKEKPAKATGNDKFEARPGRDDWYETVKLNYGVDYLNERKRYFDPVPDTWHKMLRILKFWADKGVDGFRCDMAEMVPVEFWNWAITKVKEEFSEVIFIAEIYNPLEYHNYVHKGGFDYLYDKVGLYDTLKHILTENGSTSAITSCWQILEGLDQHMLRFVENHDEVRLASAAFAGNPHAGIPAMTVSAALNTGPVLTYSGQEVGEPAAGKAGFSGDDGRTTIYDYFNMPAHQQWMNEGKFDGGQLDENQRRLRQFYQKILNLSIRNDAVINGRFYDLMWANTWESLPNRDKVYAWLRFTENQRLLFVVNFESQHSSNVKIRIPEHAFGEMGWNDAEQFTYHEILWNRCRDRISKTEAAQSGVPVKLNPFDAVVIEVTKSS